MFVHTFGSEQQHVLDFASGAFQGIFPTIVIQDGTPTLGFDLDVGANRLNHVIPGNPPLGQNLFPILARQDQFGRILTEHFAPFKVVQSYGWTVVVFPPDTV